MLTVSIILALVAAAYLLSTIRGRRINDHPLCRKCSFDLHGLPLDETERCPECGCRTFGGTNVRIGARRRRPTEIFAAACLSFIMLAFVGLMSWAASVDFDWNSVKPAGLLIRESKSANLVRSEAAIDSLIERLQAQTMAEGAATRAVDLAIARQADVSTPWRTEWGDLVEHAYDGGYVSMEQWTTYAQQALEPRLEVRPRVRAGEPLPVKLTILIRAGTRGPRTNLRVHVGPVALDGEIHDPRTLGHTAGVAGNGFNSIVRKTFYLPHPREGRAEVTVHAHVDVGDQASRGGASLGTVDLTTTAPIEIVAPDTGIITFAEATDGRRTALDGGTTARFLSSFSGIPVLRIRRDDVVVPIAARVILRQGEVETDIGSFVAGLMDEDVVIDSDASAMQPGVYDVILRPDRALARRHVGIDGIWPEDIVIEGVVLK